MIRPFSAEHIHKLNRNSEYFRRICNNAERCTLPNRTRHLILCQLCLQVCVWFMCRALTFLPKTVWLCATSKHSDDDDNVIDDGTIAVFAIKCGEKRRENATVGTSILNVVCPVLYVFSHFLFFFFFIFAIIEMHARRTYMHTCTQPERCVCVCVGPVCKSEWVSERMCA